VSSRPAVPGYDNALRPLDVSDCARCFLGAPRLDRPPEGLRLFVPIDEFRVTISAHRYESGHTATRIDRRSAKGSDGRRRDARAHPRGRAQRHDHEHDRQSPSFTLWLARAPCWPCRSHAAGGITDSRAARLKSPRWDNRAMRSVSVTMPIRPLSSTTRIEPILRSAIRRTAVASDS